MIGSNIYGWRGIEETGGLGDDSPTAGISCGKFEAEGVTSVEMMIFIQKTCCKIFWPTAKIKKWPLLYILNHVVKMFAE